jgi:hypothetical protein
VSDRVLASWRRSEDYGVSLEAVDPVFAGTFDQESLFFQCGHEVLTGLHQTLANEPISLMLTDADGLVLNRLSGDTSLVRALDDVHLAPGFSYAEREAGTNGLGLALADRSPTLVRADEHYSASLCTYTCAAAPVLDPPTGRARGRGQHHDVVQLVQRPAAGARAVGGEQHLGADAGALDRSPPSTRTGRAGLPRRAGAARAGFRHGRGPVCAVDARRRRGGSGDVGRPVGRRGRRAGVRAVHSPGPSGASGLAAGPRPQRPCAASHGRRSLDVAVVTGARQTAYRRHRR